MGSGTPSVSPACSPNESSESSDSRPASPMFDFPFLVEPTPSDPVGTTGFGIELHVVCVDNPNILVLLSLFEGTIRQLRNEMARRGNGGAHDSYIFDWDTGRCLSDAFRVGQYANSVARIHCVPYSDYDRTPIPNFQGATEWSAVYRRFDTLARVAGDHEHYDGDHEYQFPLPLGALRPEQGWPDWCSGSWNSTPPCQTGSWWGAIIGPMWPEAYGSQWGSIVGPPSAPPSPPEPSAASRSI